MEKIIGILLGVILAILILNALSAAVALILWAGWQYVAVPAFHAPALSFMQMWIVTGVLVSLASIFRKSAK